MIRVATIATNTQGRDFIFGDLHGHYDILMRMLDKHRFDPSVDRAISVGDVVNRGPRSWASVQLFRESWFYGVIGNHEQHLLGLAVLARKMLADQIELGTLIDAIREIGSCMRATWFADWLSVQSNHTDIDALITLLNSVPHVLAVRGEGFNYNVVHAELAQSGVSSDTDLATIANHADEVMQDALLWSMKLREESARQSKTCTTLDRFNAESGLSLTFCGHNVVPQPLFYRNHMFIDTGCGFLLEDYPAFEGHLGLTVCIVPDFEIAFEATALLRRTSAKQRSSSVLRAA